ncbi:NAD(P)-dependent oxidoreductase [Hydrogenophaga sp. 5NK40-0174]|uniref:NAD(P)-dependent oxidoreductase n=1 Tax=Hydrogenophaga sp. 5NK40-0174 TaxID=3127649 RepID=UPI0031054A14
MVARTTHSAMEVAFVGAGNMGGAMVERLREQGVGVAVCDIDPVRQAQAEKAGANLVGTPAESAAALCAGGVLFVVVVTAQQCREVLFGADGAAPELKPGQVVVLCPTIAPADVEALAQQLQALSIACVDAPLSGGPVRARDGSMSMMVAGEPAAVAAAQPWLDRVSGRQFSVGGRAGDGARTKLVNNLLAAINLAGAAEALALASQLGLDPARTLDVIEASSGQSWIGSDRMRRAIAGQEQPLAHMQLLAKDSRLAMDEARAVGVPAKVGDAAQSVFEAALHAGMAMEDDGALLPWTLARAGKTQAPPTD